MIRTFEGENANALPGFLPVQGVHPLLCFHCCSHDTARFLRLLWISLSGAKPLDTGSVPAEETAATLRGLRLEEVQLALQQGPSHRDSAMELLHEAAILYDRAFTRLTGCPVQSVLPHHRQTPADTTELGAYGLSALWGCDLRPLIREGRRSAEAWLDHPRWPLWWAVSQARAQHRAGAARDAFEAGFLLRVKELLPRC